MTTERLREHKVYIRKQGNLLRAQALIKLQNCPFFTGLRKYLCGLTVLATFSGFWRGMPNAKRVDVYLSLKEQHFFASTYLFYSESNFFWHLCSSYFSCLLGREDHPHTWLLLELIKGSEAEEGIKMYLSGLGERRMEDLEALVVLHQFLLECHFRS